MSIIRAPRADAHFTIIRNDVLRDKRLSYRARGVLAAILSRPDNWRSTSGQLAQEGLEGRDAVRTALTELEVIGYIQRIKEQDEKGHWHHHMLVFDTPQGEVTSAGKSDAGFSGANRSNEEEELSITTKDTSVVVSTSHVEESPAKELCNLLADRIQENGYPRPTVSVDWVRSMDRLIRLDHREPEQIRAAIEWVARHDFWSMNIRSPQKLREHYPRLQQEAMRETARKQPRGMSAVAAVLAEENQ